nr:hypothetical protein [uncultured Rhodoferax sp.]
MQLGQPTPKFASGVTALFFTFNSSRFLAIAVPHNFAAELGSPQRADAYKNGSFPPVEWIREADGVAKEQLNDLRRSLVKSAFISLVVALVVVIALGLFGKVGLGLPVDVGKLVAAIGTFSAGWASVLQLHPVQRTFRENFIHEVAHKAAVRAALLVGVVLGALGVLWW